MLHLLLYVAAAPLAPHGYHWADALVPDAATPGAIEEHSLERFGREC